MSNPAFQDLPGDQPQARSFPEGSSITPGQVPSDSQPTVISNGPPLLLPHVSYGMHPSELGKRLEGEQLGHFKLEEFIGGGGMGAVFRAHDTMLDRIVAVKVLSTGHACDEETLRRFKNEAQSAARLDHENIARVYYVSEDRGVHYIVFEHIAGVNVRDLVDQQGPLALPEAISFTWQVAEALNHASQRDVVHRDIKPSNILITPEGRAKLVDMGLARLHQVEQHAKNDLTASGVTLGTFDYISPEQARDPRTADVRSDLYSLGCTLFFMLTGRPPFPDGTVIQKVLQHQGDEPPDPRDFRPELPREVSRIVAKLLAKLPESRYQDPTALAVDLTALSQQLVEWDPTVVQPDSAFRRHAPWLVPVTLLLLSVAVLDRIWSARAPSEPVYEPIRAADPSAGSGQDRASGAPNTGAAVAPAVTSQADVADVLTTSIAKIDGPPRSTLPSDLIKRPATGPLRTAASNPVSDRLGNASPGRSLQQEQLASSATAVQAESAGLIASESEHNGLDAAGASETAASKTLVEPKSRQPAVRIVAPHDPTAFGSLVAACNSANSGDVIELRYNDALVERPLRLSNLKLTIRAAEGYYPRVAFQPGPGDSDPLQYPRSMITVNGGELTLIGVQLELDVPREVASESWALIEATGAEQINLKRCWLTIRNAAEGHRAYHQGVAFFDVKPSPVGMMVATDSPRKEKPLTVRLESCIARGEAAFLSSGPAQDIQLYWEDGLLAASERMVVVQPDQVARRERGHLQVDLRHLTALLQEGLALVTSGMDSQPATEIRIKCKDSILVAGDDAPLIEQRGLERFHPGKDVVVWSGERNFYEGFEDFWKISSDVAREAERLDLLKWKEYWAGQSDGDEILPHNGMVGWKQLPSQTRPLHAHTPDDYVLSESPNNPARGAATDARDVGFRVELLPALAPRPEAPFEQSPAPAPAVGEGAAD